MFNRTIPSLRNFAVLELQQRSLKGKVYRVQDRRTAKQDQLLFVPNRSISWPRYLDSLAKFGGTPVRLRNANVAFLLTEGQELEHLVAALKPLRTKRWRFNSLVGFHNSAASGPKRVAILAFGACLITVALSLFFAWTPLVPETKELHPTESLTKVTTICHEEIHVGDRFRYNKKSSKLALNEVRREVKNVQQLGGFLRATLQSNCETKMLSIEAWLQGKTYEVTYLG
ncbi:MAG: hypothetical protein WCG32_00625 [Actinomycetes bacterium]